MCTIPEWRDSQSTQSRNVRKHRVSFLSGALHRVEQMSQFTHVVSSLSGSCVDTRNCAQLRTNISFPRMSSNLSRQSRPLLPGIYSPLLEVNRRDALPGSQVDVLSLRSLVAAPHVRRLLSRCYAGRTKRDKPVRLTQLPGRPFRASLYQCREQIATIDGTAMSDVLC